MKKFTILVSLFLFSIGTSFSQDPTFGESTTNHSGVNLAKGNWYLGGMLGFTFTNEKHEDSGGSSQGPKTTSFDLLPTGGVVIGDKTAVGGSLGYLSSTEKRYEIDFSTGDEFELKNTENQFVISPFGSFFKELDDDFFCMGYLYGMLGFGSQKDEFLSGDEIFTQEFKKNSWELGFSPGFKWFPNEKISLGFSYGKIYYGGETLTDKEDSEHKWKTSQGGIDLDLSTARVGISYWFPAEF
ncbi:MAG: hypothetical protein DRI54_00535 [Bacteroidetes bacterium]|nr:MAG: hypothetical protein DRI54_00535 [Bacteroidota bacterium]